MLIEWPSLFLFPHPLPFSSCYHSGFLSISSHRRASFLLCVSKFLELPWQTSCLQSLPTLLPFLCGFPTCLLNAHLPPLLHPHTVSGLQLHQENLQQPSSSRPVAFSELSLRLHFIWGRLVPLVVRNINKSPRSVKHQAQE